MKFFHYSSCLVIGLLFAGVVNAEISFGGYLAGRHALSAKDFDAASTYLSRVIKDDLENPFETEFQDVATPENAANRDLKSAYADNNEIKAYQAEWDLNIL